MSNLVKQKQIENLTTDLAAKASTSQVLLKNNNLNDLPSVSESRNNLDVHSKAEVNALISGAKNTRSVNNIAARDALTGLQVSDRIFVSNDGDGKWALYIVLTATNGNGNTCEYEKISDADLFNQGMTAEAIKTAYESNANTNEFSDAEKSKLSKITVTESVNLNTMANSISTNTTKANSAQTAANNAYNLASNKQDQFMESKETFSGITAEPNTNIALRLNNNIKDGFAVLVFFGTLFIDNAVWSSGSNTVTISVPYETNESDKIHVVYKHDYTV